METNDETNTTYEHNKVQNSIRPETDQQVAEESLPHRSIPLNPTLTSQRILTNECFEPLRRRELVATTGLLHSATQHRITSKF